MLKVHCLILLCAIAAIRAHVGLFPYTHPKKYEAIRSVLHFFSQEKNKIKISHRGAGEKSKWIRRNKSSEYPPILTNSLVRIFFKSCLKYPPIILFIPFPICLYFNKSHREKCWDDLTYHNCNEGGEETFYKKIPQLSFQKMSNNSLEQIFTSSINQCLF